MEWVARLRGKIVGLDTAPLIYFIEDHPKYAGPLATFFQEADRGVIQIVTSTVTLAEVLVQPLRLKHLDLVDRYRQVLLASKSFQTVAVSAEIAERAAQLRAQQRLRTPDAIQIATAISAGAAAFLTNDARLVRTSAIEVLVMSELCGD